MVSFYFTTFI